MTLDEALDIAVARTGHARFRELCDPAHPDYQPAYIPVVMRLASGPWPPVPEYPPLALQAANLGRAFFDWAVSGFTMATEDEQARRLMICAGCTYFEPAARRCRICGCHLMLKVQARTGHCPLPEPKW